MSLPNEGRIRPSLIAASWLAGEDPTRGTTRGEFAPPSLRHGGRGRRRLSGGNNEGRIRPSLMGRWGFESRWGGCGNNEGRIRPSLIAAGRPTSCRSAPASNEGRIRPSLIAADMGWSGISRSSVQRGANSPLPHCGSGPATGQRSPSTNEGRIRPSLIAASFPDRGAGADSSTRGEFAPPSLRPGSPLSYRPAGTGQRGANSPLPHCGRSPSGSTGIGFRTTRGEFAPPSLRPPGRFGSSVRPVCNEGRIRPSLIAAHFLPPVRVKLAPNEGRIRPSLIAARIYAEE